MSTVLSIPTEVRRDIAAGLEAPHARWLVDYYYSVQDFRIQAWGQARAVAQDADEGVVELSQLLGQNMEITENEIKKALNDYAQTKPPGVWAMSQIGIGPVLAAGLLAHIDITQAKTAGAIWRFAGLDSTVRWHGREGIRKLIDDARSVEPDDYRALVWLCRAINYRPGHVLKAAGLIEETVSVEAAQKIVDRFEGDPIDNVQFEGDNMLLKAFPDEYAGEAFETAYPGVKWSWAAIQQALAKRPWNGNLKVLCWKIGDSFVKQSGHENCLYGHIYRQRKEQEISKNDAGDFAAQAATSLEQRKIKDKDLRTTYEAGRLPAGRLDLRARRYAVKLFLSHLHEAMYFDHYDELPPKPYVMAHLGHVDYFAARNMELIPGWKEARAALKT